MSDLKKQLHQLCIDFVKQRIANAKLAIESAEQSAAEDTKSSAGDKYETGREMLQQETDRNMAQLNEAKKLMVALSQIAYNTTHTVAEPGGLITTDNGKFYIAISVGALNVDGETIFAVSPASPIGLKLIGLKPGDEFTLNSKLYKIKDIK